MYSAIYPERLLIEFIEMNVIYIHAEVFFKRINTRRCLREVL